jgi:competence protein ComEC
MLAFSSGIAAVQMLAVLPSPAVCAAIAAGAIMCGGLTIRLIAPGRYRFALSVLCAVALGIAWAATFAHGRLNDRLLPQWEGRDITLIGTVADLPSVTLQGTRFILNVERVLPRDPDASADTTIGTRDIVPVVPHRLSLGWYAAGVGAGPGSGATLVPHIMPGSRWQLTVRLNRPHGNANPFGFDYELRMLERGIGATGYVRDGAAHPALLLAPFVITPSHLLQRARAYLQQKILGVLADAPHAGVMVALVIGEQRAIRQADWDVFRRTGVNHLVAISGLHIMLVAGLFGRAVLFLWCRSFGLSRWLSTPLPLSLPAQKASMLATVAAGAVYVALAGFGIPAQRALAMLVVVALAFCLGRVSSPSRILCIALCVVLLLDPWALLWPGFHLSFTAVGVILYASAGRSRRRSASAGPVQRLWVLKMLNTLVEASRTQWAVSLGLLPLTLFMFAQYSLIAPLANAIAIPAVTLLVVPLALLGSVLPAPLAGWALEGAHTTFSLVYFSLEWLATLPLAIWQTPLPGWPLFLTAAAGTLLLLAPRGWPLRWAGLFGWFPLLLAGPSHPEAGEFRVIAFDVGQGMSLLVETARHRLLYDTGPPYGPDADAGNRVILPYLHARGIAALDVIVVSHSDNDHAGGALSILEALPVNRVITSLPMGSAIARAAAEHVRCVAGQHWQWDGITFEILYPAEAVYHDHKLSANAHSCVLKISNGEQSILLPGDIGIAQEKQLINTYSEAKMRATVLLAPHHGSRTSSSSDLLRAVAPALAIFQVGYRNRFHHPQAAVYRRYHDYDIRDVRTDGDGAITLQFGTAMQYQVYRRQRKRYWHHQMEVND